MNLIKSLEIPIVVPAWKVSFIVPFISCENYIMLHDSNRLPHLLYDVFGLKLLVEDCDSDKLVQATQKG